MIKCRYCGEPAKMRYPGNDPENGPAYMGCGKDNCYNQMEDERAAKYYRSASANDVYDEAMEDNKINTQCDEWVINYREREADSRALALYKISYALTDSMTTKDQLRLMADALDNMAECLTGKRDQSRYRRVTKGGLDCQAFTVTDKYALSDEDE